MIWQHLEAPPAQWRAWPAAVASVSGDDTVTVVALANPAAIQFVAATATEWTMPVTWWIRVSERYTAPMAARDVKTLSWIVTVSDVVISSDDGVAADHGRVVAELLRSDDVTLTTSVVTLRHAFNRPLPPHPVTVWVTNAAPSDDDIELREIAHADSDQGARVVHSARRTWGA